MKKAILIVAALVLVLSGVAAVSAWEAHTVNVKALVENAIMLKQTNATGNDIDLVSGELNFGTVFPQEWLTGAFDIGLSASFCEQGNEAAGIPEQKRVTRVDYALWVAQKDGNYLWPAGYMYVGIDPSTTPPLAADLSPIPADPGPNAVVKIPGSDNFIWKTVSTSQTNENPDPLDTVWVGIDGPVFTGSYNQLTDEAAFDLAGGGTKPSGKTAPSVELPASDEHSWVGFDLIVQVTGISWYDPLPPQ